MQRAVTGTVEEELKKEAKTGLRGAIGRKSGSML